VANQRYEEFPADLRTVERALITINRSVIRCHQLLDCLTPYGSDQWDLDTSVVRPVWLAGRDIARVGTALAKVGTTSTRDTDAAVLSVTTASKATMPRRARTAPTDAENE
jgi:hypothetical protein